MEHVFRDLNGDTVSPVDWLREYADMAAPSNGGDSEDARGLRVIADMLACLRATVTEPQDGDDSGYAEQYDRGHRAACADVLAILDSAAASPLRGRSGPAGADDWDWAGRCAAAVQLIAHRWGTPGGELRADAPDGVGEIADTLLGIPRARAGIDVATPTPTPTPAVADALARAERGGDMPACIVDLCEAAKAYRDAADTFKHSTERGHGPLYCASNAARRVYADRLRNLAAAGAQWGEASKFFAALPDSFASAGALAGQLARAEGRDEYAIALQRLCEWAAALMRGESREMPAGSLDASPHHARLLADAASALDAARARLAAAERVGRDADAEVTRMDYLRGLMQGHDDGSWSIDARFAVAPDGGGVDPVGHALDHAIRTATPAAAPHHVGSRAGGV